MKKQGFNVRVLISFASLLVIVVMAFALSWQTPEAKEQPTISSAPGLAARYAAFSTADSVTTDIRSRSKRLTRVGTADAADKTLAAKYGRIVNDYGAFVVISTDANSAIDRSGLDIQPLETSINLPGAKFDPILDPPDGKGIRARSGHSGDGYYVVQFGTIATDEMLDSLRDIGVEILQYVPNQAFLVYASGDAIAKAEQHSRVRWVGRFLPEQKLSNVLKQQLSSARGASRLDRKISTLELSEKGTAIFNVAVFKRGDLNDAANQIAFAYGAKIVSISSLPNNFFNLVRVEAPVDAIEAVANIPDVIRIDAWHRPTKEDERANQIIAGNYTNSTTIAPPGYDPLTQFGVDGTNVTVSVVDDGVGIPGDGGFYMTGANTVNAPLRGATAGALGHGHLNATIIAGNAPFGGLDPTGYNYGLGVAPKAHIINVPLLRDGYVGTDPDIYNDTVTTAGPNGVNGYVSNNSWGAGLNGNVYDAMAAEWDGFVRDSSIAATIDPVCMVFSAGNSGQTGLTEPKVAKNLIATASGDNLRPELAGTAADNIGDISSFSSRGLAADTRIKPDIAAPGSGISGGRSGTDALFGNIDANHRWSEGTSHAAPQIAGLAALFTQFWKNVNGGANPSPALVKAAVIASGQEMTGSGATTAVPNRDEGWGRVNGKLIFPPCFTNKFVNETTTLSNVGESTSISGFVASSAKPIRIALVWTDPPGVADPALVNDLDLTVTVGATVYKGNIFSGGNSATGGTADNRNNVENVWLPPGTARGTNISIQVSAAALNGDGVLGNADVTDQHFALVAYNVVDVPDPIIESAASGAPAIISENLLPLNNAPDPGELVTVNLPLINIGGDSSTNLTAALQPTGGVSSPSGPQNYGAMAPASPAVSRPFTFTAQGQCGSTITLTLALSDTTGTACPMTVTYKMRLGTQSTAASYSENFDAVTAPNLPAGWTTAVTTGVLAPWVTSTTNPSSAPNGVFANDIATVSNTELISPSLAIPSGGGQVTFRNLFNTENTFDGMVLEISIAGGAYADILDAGGTFAAGGYNASISTNATFLSPILGRPAWTGLSGGTTAAPTYITTTVNLPPAAAGQNIKLKWRMATDNSTAPATNPGVRIDTVTLSTTGNVCSSITTAAGVEVSGRILTSDGRGVTNANVRISDGSGIVRTGVTGRNGRFVFDDVEAGRTYVISVVSRRFSYEPRVIHVTDNVGNLVFIPSE